MYLYVFHKFKYLFYHFRALAVRIRNSLFQNILYIYALSDKRMDLLESNCIKAHERKIRTIYNILALFFTLFALFGKIK